MGFANHKSFRQDNLVSVKTEFLREKLNYLYDSLRTNPQAMSSWGRFDYLWDLKELALVQGLNSIDIPFNWLEELEEFSTNTKSFHPGH
jgi:hypothetical protein